MRVRWIIACCVALLTAACDTTESKYFRYGIGTDLYTADIAQETQFQDIYLTELCRQALPVLSGAEGQCLSGVPSSGGWNLIVQAGLNDVDRRCDSYLAWLDDRRRTNNAVLKELGDITVASQAIMRVAGVSANPITLAGLAFGLAANTFTNVNSRLLLEVDKTTVQTLVLHRRNQYRIDINSLSIDSRPAAVHALRSYLNICTPFTIETDINATITVFQNGGASALNRPPLIDPATIRGAVIERARDQMPERKFSSVKGVGAAFITNVQSALCVVNVTGIMDPLTGIAVQEYLKAKKLAPAPEPVDPTSPAIRPTMQAVIDDVGNCKTAGFRNVFEVGRYGVPATTRSKRLKTLQTKMAALLVAQQSSVTVQPTGDLDDQTRAAIREIRKGTGATAGDQLDTSLLTKILGGS